MALWSCSACPQWYTPANKGIILLKWFHQLGPSNIRAYRGCSHLNQHSLAKKSHTQSGFDLQHSIKLDIVVHTCNPSPPSRSSRSSSVVQWALNQPGTHKILPQNRRTAQAAIVIVSLQQPKRTQRNEKFCSQKNVYPHAHSNRVTNSYKLKTCKMSVSSLAGNQSPLQYGILHCDQKNKCTGLGCESLSDKQTQFQKAMCCTVHSCCCCRCCCCCC